MFDKGQVNTTFKAFCKFSPSLILNEKIKVPEAGVGEKDKATLEKEAELEMMRKGRRDQVLPLQKIIY